MEETSFPEEQLSLERGLLILEDQKFIALKKANFCNSETIRSQSLCEACSELYHGCSYKEEIKMC